MNRVAFAQITPTSIHVIRDVEPHPVHGGSRRTLLVEDPNIVYNRPLSRMSRYANRRKARQLAAARREQRHRREVQP